jgi:hypothetical protein
VSFCLLFRFVWPPKDDKQIIEATTVLGKISAPVLCSFSTRRHMIFRFPIEDVVKINTLVQSLVRS